MKRQINFFQYIRGIGAIIVALVHFEPHLSMALAGDKTTFKFFHYFGYVFVDLFFMISGFVIWLTTYRLNIQNRLDNTVDFLIKRCTRIYLPYIPILLVTLLAFMLFAKQYQTDTIGIIKMIFLYPYQNHILPMSWTLSYEMLFYLLFALLIFICASLRMRVILTFVYLLIVLSFNLYTFFFLDTNHYGALLTLFPNTDSTTLFALSYIVSPYMMEFCIGVFLAAYYFSRPLFSQKKWICIFKYLLYVTIVLAHIYFYKIGVELQTKEFERVAILAPILGALMYILLCEEVQYPDKKPNAFLIESGNASYLLYLVHFTVLYGVIFLHLSEQKSIMNFFIIVFIFISMVLLSIVASKHIEIPMYQWVVKKLAKPKVRTN